MCNVIIERPAALSVARPQRAIASVMLAVCLLSALLGRAVYLSDTFGGDGAMFAYMGKLTAEGGRLGQDLIDNKFPTVGFVTSIFWRSFGAWWPGYVIAQTAMSLAACWILARAAGRAFGEHARLATLLPAVVLMNLNAAVMGGFQLETIQTFFACIAAACAMEALNGDDWRDALASGLAAGCAILVKPTGGAVFAALLLGAIVRWIIFGKRTRPWKLPVGALTGVAIPLLCCIVYLDASDQLRIIPQIARQISDYAAGSSFNPWDLYRPLSLVFLFAMAMLIRGWVYRRRAVESVRGAFPLWVFAGAWLMLELCGVLMQRRMYAYHFLPLAAPAALVFGSLPRRTTMAQLAGVLIVPVLFNLWGSIDTIRDLRMHPQTWPAVTQWLDEHCLPGERIWRDQTMYVLLHSDLRPASRIQLTFIFMNTDDSPQKFGSILLDDWKRNRPRFIVLPADVEGHIRTQTSGVLELARLPHRAENFTRAWRDISTFVRDRYEPVKTIGEETIWKKIGSE